MLFGLLRACVLSRVEFMYVVLHYIFQITLTFVNKISKTIKVNGEIHNSSSSDCEMIWLVYGSMPAKPLKNHWYQWCLRKKTLTFPSLWKNYYCHALHGKFLPRVFMATLTSFNAIHCNRTEFWHKPFFHKLIIIIKSSSSSSSSTSSSSSLLPLPFPKCF